MASPLVTLQGHKVNPQSVSALEARGPDTLVHVDGVTIYIANQTPAQVEAVIFADPPAPDPDA